MKKCPRCGQTYTDPELNFCLADGELLTDLSTSPRPYDPDPPPTILMDPVRTTNPTGWQGGGPVGQYQAPAPQWQSSAPVGSGAPGFGYSFGGAYGQSSPLPMISLILGIASMTVGWCCSLGLILSPAALITGIIALVQARSNPQNAGGQGLAIAGIVLSILFLILYVLYIVFIVGMAIFSGR